jgi:hypothetical protein
MSCNSEFLGQFGLQYLRKQLKELKSSGHKYGYQNFDYNDGRLRVYGTVAIRYLPLFARSRFYGSCKSVYITLSEDETEGLRQVDLLSHFLLRVPWTVPTFSIDHMPPMKPSQLCLFVSLIQSKELRFCSPLLLLPSDHSTIPYFPYIALKDLTLTLCGEETHSTLSFYYWLTANSTILSVVIRVATSLPPNINRWLTLANVKSLTITMVEDETAVGTAKPADILPLLATVPKVQLLRLEGGSQSLAPSDRSVLLPDMMLSIASARNHIWLGKYSSRPKSQWVTVLDTPCLRATIDGFLDYIGRCADLQTLEFQIGDLGSLVPFSVNDVRIDVKVRVVRLCFRDLVMSEAAAEKIWVGLLYDT